MKWNSLSVRNGVVHWNTPVDTITWAWHEGWGLVADLKGHSRISVSILAFRHYKKLIYCPHFLEDDEIRWEIENYIIFERIFWPFLFLFLPFNNVKCYFNIVPLWRSNLAGEALFINFHYLIEPTVVQGTLYFSKYLYLNLWVIFHLFFSPLCNLGRGVIEHPGGHVVSTHHLTLVKFKRKGKFCHVFEWQVLKHL